jgi:DNA-binding winged helix-turn-helix (wHTH) protein
MRRFQIGAWRIDGAARTAANGDLVRRLSPRAIQVLEALAEADGEVAPRGDLLDAVWPDDDVGDDVLTHAIAELRKALGRDCIETVYAGGYRLRERARHLAGGGSAVSADALAAYMQAQSLADDGGRANTEEAIRIYREAIQGAAGFAPAHAGLATTLVKLRHYYGGGAALMREAVERAEVAAAADPASCEGHAALGAARAAASGLDAAMRSFGAALALRPDAPEPYRLLARVYFVNGMHAAAVSACERAARLREDEFQCIVMGAKALRALGDTERADAWMRWARVRIERKLSEQPDNLRALCNLVCCQIEAGEHDAAFALLRRLRAEHDGMVYYLVGALARAGHIDLALDQLEAVIDCGWSHGAYLMHDADLDPLRRERRFQRIAGKLNAA